MILRNIWLSAKFLQTWLDFFFLPLSGCWQTLPSCSRARMDARSENVTSAKRAYLAWMEEEEHEKTAWVYKCSAAQETDRLKGRQVLCEITGSLLSVWLWISLLFHFSLASPLSTSICNPLIFSCPLLHRFLSQPTFSLCVHAVCVCVCVRGMIFWCPRCVWVLCLSTFSGWPLCLQPSYCSPTHSIRKWACAGA